MDCSLFPRIRELLDSCRSGNIAKVQLLVSTTPHIVISSDGDGVSPLHVASHCGCLDIVRLLLISGAPINTTTCDGSTPLGDACAGCHPDIVHYLLENGAVVNPGLALTSPLHEATFSGSYVCCKMLIQKGADVSKFDLHFGTPLHSAAYRGHIEIAGLLLDSGADINATKILSTPLHVSVEQSCWKMAFYLLLRGANYKLQNNNDKSVGHLLPPKHPFHQLMHNFDVYPKSLKHLSRMCIKKALKFNDPDFIGLPACLVDYLNFVQDLLEYSSFET